MRVARHAQINQNNKVAISLQYLKKEVSDEVDFCMQISMKASYKLILWILMGMVKYSQSSQHSKFQCLYNISKKKLEMKLFFLPAENRQSFLQVDFNTGHQSFLQGDAIKQSKITQSNKFAISLQYLKKEVSNGVHFWHADECQSFYNLLSSILMKVARHVQNTQKREVGNICGIY